MHDLNLYKSQRGSVCGAGNCIASVTNYDESEGKKEKSFCKKKNCKTFIEKKITQTVLHIHE